MAVKRILRYVKSSVDLGLKLNSSSSTIISAFQMLIGLDQLMTEDQLVVSLSSWVQFGFLECTKQSTKQSISYSILF